jgi:hypothetical protein
MPRTNQRLGRVTVSRRRSAVGRTHAIAFAERGAAEIDNDIDEAPPIQTSEDRRRGRYRTTTLRQLLRRGCREIPCGEHVCRVRRPRCCGQQRGHRSDRQARRRQLRAASRVVRGSRSGSSPCVYGDVAALHQQGLRSHCECDVVSGKLRDGKSPAVLHRKGRCTGSHSRSSPVGAWPNGLCRTAASHPCALTRSTTRAARPQRSPPVPASRRHAAACPPRTKRERPASRRGRQRCDSPG